MKRFFLILISMNIIFNLYAQDTNNIIYSRSGGASFDNDDYHIDCFFVDDIQKVTDIWSKPSTPDLTILQINQIKKAKPMTIVFVYSTKKEKINMTYDLDTFFPDRTFSEKYSAEGILIKNGNIPDSKFYLTDNRVTIAFGLNDPPGIYQLQMPIYDNNELIVRFILEIEVVE